EVVDGNGNIIGGIGKNWYEKAPLPAETVDEEDVSLALKLLESGTYKKSLGIALTPDGEYLGDIDENHRVINREGVVVGQLMPDGLVIDDDGNLIGIKETQRSEGSGMFVPPGTFGDGGAYGVGTGTPGNLGPGGGYGPGERYDPARQAALDAAMAERRKNISVGKISSGVRKEAFDGMQKDWSEQGISKVISSWRVDMSEMIFSDKPIPAVIARAIDSNNPAPITAFVERNVYAEEGRNVIIPAGSRLIGSLGGVSASTESTSESARVQISWERLIRPDGSIFVFQALTADAQGRGGALGYVDQQLFKKYTLPVLTSSLTSATSYFMAPGDNDSENESPRQQAANDARENFINEMNQVFDEILADKSNIKPLTYIPAGTRIIVYPNSDLWLRSVERDSEESAKFQAEKPTVLLDDTKGGSLKDGPTPQPGSSASTGGDVVYDAGADVEEAPNVALIDDTSSKKNKKAASYIAPPPPPSSPSSSAPSSSSASSSKKSGDDAIPALF
ncbi:MAG: TrbI/VirB10 family protein, partial [Firmicutes bacterium]|nr:TrbI/VirB10 family protein [Bacillota bacterium]